MKIGRLKRDKGLNWGVSFEQDFNTNNILAKDFAVWFFKLREVPEAGESARIDKLNYWGFWLKKKVFTQWNIIIYTKSINFIYWIKIKKQ
jgi:hypothetical protein